MRRSYRRKRNYSRRKRGYHPYIKYTAPAVGYVAAKAAQMVAKKYLNPEFKKCEVASAGVAVSNVGTRAYITAIAQGATDIARNGDSVKITGMLVNFSATINAAATTTFIRFVIVADNDSNGTNLPDMYAGGVDDFLTSADAVNGLRELDNSKRFQVLMDRTIKLSQDANHLQKRYKVFKKFNKHVHYVGTTAGTNHAGRGSIWLLMLSNEAVNTPTVKYSIRSRFLDN